MSFTRRLLASLTFLVCMSGAASAHPHVFLSSTSEIMYDGRGRVTGVKHHWTFDETFSSYATQGVDTNGDGTFSREELAPLATTNVENLKDFDYFTFARLGGTRLLFRPPEDHYLTYASGRLTLHFFLPLSSPQTQGTRVLAIQIYDPSYFVAFDLAQDNPASITGAPPGCVVNITRPKPLSDEQKNAAQQLDESSFTAIESGAGFGAQFASTILVNCP